MQILLALLLIALCLVAVLLGRALARRPESTPPPHAQPAAVDAMAVAEKLSAALRIRSVSYEDAAHNDPHQLQAMHELLEQLFPRVHASLTRELVSRYSLLFTWKGSDPTLPPLVLTAHLDVVPVDADSEAQWSHPPFSGRIDSGFVWGRGALDDKNALIAILEAVELLLADGFRPHRTVYLAFGHDEELGGRAGAAQIVETLRSRGVAPAMVVDEGLPVLDGVVPGVARPVALVGLAEKGQALVEMTVEVEGGHASIPPRETAVGRISRAIVRLESRPFRPRLRGLSRRMFERLTPEMSFTGRFVFANLWLFSPLVRRKLTAASSTNALLRTTAAPTIVRGGEKANVLPRNARAVVDFRIPPGDRVEDVVRHVEGVIDDPHIRVRVLDGASPPTPVSSADSAPFRALQSSICSVFPEAAVAPSLMVARSDARHYQSIATDVYRFSPVLMQQEDLAQLHGVDERISVEAVGRMVAFYVELLRRDV